jgi:solute carrier family 35, member F1/2
MYFSRIYMKSKYHWTQLLVSDTFLRFLVDTPFAQGVAVCIGGLVMLVASDRLTDKNYRAVARGKGDALMVAGATLYGFSCVIASRGLAARDLTPLHCSERV